MILEFLLDLLDLGEVKDGVSRSGKYDPGEHDRSVDSGRGGVGVGEEVAFEEEGDCARDETGDPEATGGVRGQLGSPRDVRIPDLVMWKSDGQQVCTTSVIEVVR